MNSTPVPPQQPGTPQGEHPAYPAYPAYPGYSPAPPRPPLEPRARRGALLAGGVSFALISTGFGLTVLSVIAIAFVGIGTFVADQFRRRAERGGDQVMQFFDELSIAGWWPIALVTLLIGVLIAVGGLLLSPRILRRRGVERAWAVTGSGLGIAVVASWIVSGIGSSVSSVAGVLPGGGSDTGPDIGAALAIGVVLLVVSSLVSLAVNVAIGALAWWWMAHVFRPRPIPQHPSPTTPASPTAAPAAPAP